MAEDEFRGLPQTRRSAYTPEGQIEQVNKFADAVIHSPDGRRKRLLRAGVVIVVAAMLLPLILGVFAALANSPSTP